MKKFLDMLVIGIMCFFLTIGMVIQINGVAKDSKVVAQKNLENNLRDQVLKLTDSYNKKLSSLQRSEKKLDELRTGVANINEQTKEWVEELEEMNNCMGNTNLVGNGISIQINYAKFNVPKLINSIYNTGVDAISINGIRIGAATVLYNEADILYIDGNKVSLPYEIKVIGNSYLYKALTMPGSYIYNLKTEKSYEKGSINIMEEKNIYIEKSNSVKNFNYAKISE